MSTRLHRRHVPKAASFTVVAPRDSAGTVFTNRGATGAITATLPAPSAALLGWWYRFMAVVDQNFIVAVPTADTAIAVNDLAADSLALQTSSEKIGGIIEAECVQTGAATFQWVLSGQAVAHTYTVATA